MRVVTANLFFGRARPGSVQDAVRSVDPDVLAVQELTPTVADAISEVMSHGRHKMRWRGASLGLFFSRPAEAL